MASDTTYSLLSVSSQDFVRTQIESSHAWFYHGTTRACVSGILQRGLDPAFEHEGSEYFWDRLEPEKALRYCAEATLQCALETAEERARWRDSADPTKLDPADIVLLRVKASELLKRSFGLDHAYLDDMTVRTQLDTDGLLPPQKFIDLFNDSGMISCYEALPQEVLQIYSGSFYDDHPGIQKDKFIPL